MAHFIMRLPTIVRFVPSQIVPPVLILLFAVCAIRIIRIIFWLILLVASAMLRLICLLIVLSAVKAALYRSAWTALP